MFKYYMNTFGTLQKTDYQFTYDRVIVDTYHTMESKPEGPYLWGSTYDEDTDDTPWIRYCKQYLPERLHGTKLFLFTVDYHANILILDSISSMIQLETFILKSSFDDINLLDWEGISKRYDGFYITKEIIDKYSYKGFNKVRFSQWSIESLLVWNTRIVRPIYEREVIG